VTGVCLTCGLRTDLEAHHVAGRHNHATLTVAVCVDCHRILTRWQYASGTELAEGADTAALDASRALVVGAVHLVQLFAQRHADLSWFPAPLAILAARAASKVLDALQPATRPGRWLPDPTVPPIEATPTAWPGATEVDRIVEMTHLTREVSEILGEASPLTVAVLAEIAGDPLRFQAAWDDAVSDTAIGMQVLDMVSKYLELSTEMMHRLLTLDDIAASDDELVSAAAEWFRSGEEFLTEALRIVGLTPSVSS